MQEDVRTLQVIDTSRTYKNSNNLPSASNLDLFAKFALVIFVVTILGIVQVLYIEVRMPMTMMRMRVPQILSTAWV